MYTRICNISYEFLALHRFLSLLVLCSRAATHRQRHLLHKKRHDGFGSSKPVGGFAGHRHAQRAPLLVPESDPVACYQCRTCNVISTLAEICSISKKLSKSVYILLDLLYLVTHVN